MFRGQQTCPLRWVQTSSPLRSELGTAMTFAGLIQLLRTELPLALCSTASLQKNKNATCQWVCNSELQNAITFDGSIAFALRPSPVGFWAPTFLQFSPVDKFLCIPILVSLWSQLTHHLPAQSHRNCKCQKKVHDEHKLQKKNKDRTLESDPFCDVS